MRAATPVVSAILGRLGAEPLPFAGFRRALPSLRPGSADAARALYSGYSPSGRGMPRGQTFAWLCDLEAGGLDLHRAFARKQYRLWQATEQAAVTDIDTLAGRVLNLCRWGRVLLTGASGDFDRLFIGQLGADVRRLVQARIRTPDEAVRQSASVLAAALCFGGPDRLGAEAVTRLAAAADVVIARDGGHLSRSPDRLLATLELLVPLRSLMAGMRLQVPQDLTAAIERGFPMLRMMCHGDGGLSLLQNAGIADPLLPRALLALDDVSGRTPVHGKATGFARLSLGATTVMVDCGEKALCDSALAIELSDGPHRIAGGCGYPALASVAWREAAARPAAHATLDLRSAATFAPDRLFRRRPAHVAATFADVITSPHGMLCKGQALRHCSGLTLRHCRELFLAADGGDFRGEDRFERMDGLAHDWPESEFALRFHLHPDVDAAQDRAGGTIRVTLPNGARWQFTARGGSAALEDSIFLATGGEPRFCRQIVIHGAVGRPDIVHWAFRRQSSTAT